MNLNLNDILQIIYIVVGFLTGAIPAIIGFVKAAKNKKAAKNAEEKALAEKDMITQANGFISNAETFYKSLDTLLKKQGESAGPYKKESVMNQLQAYASEKGITFDKEYWSEKVDSLVKFTKEVNAK